MSSNDFIKVLRIVFQFEIQKSMLKFLKAHFFSNVFVELKKKVEPTSLLLLSLLLLEVCMHCILFAIFVLIFNSFLMLRHENYMQYNRNQTFTDISREKTSQLRLRSHFLFFEPRRTCVLCYGILFLSI